MDIAGKLRILIEDKGLSQYAFARAAGVTPAYISEILAGKKKPTLDMLEKFCVTLNITLADFFSGISSRDAADEVVSIDTPSNSMDSGVKVYRRLVSLRESKGHSQYKLAKLSGVPQPMIKRYEDGENQPTIDNLKKLCSALEITLSEFFAEDDPPWTKADVFRRTIRQSTLSERAQTRAAQPGRRIFHRKPKKSYWSTSNICLISTGEISKKSSREKEAHGLPCAFCIILIFSI